MTTKDQAIAWYSQTLKKTRVTQINMDGEDGWMPLFPRPAPDCRTCEMKWLDYDSLPICGMPNDDPCINGNKYQPAPVLALWGTN